MDGPPVLLAEYGWSVALARLASHPMLALGPDRSAYPIAYLVDKKGESPKLDKNGEAPLVGNNGEAP